MFYIGILHVNKMHERRQCQCVSALPMFAHFPTVYFQINLPYVYKRSRGVTCTRDRRVSPVCHGLVSIRHRYFREHPPWWRHGRLTPKTCCWRYPLCPLFRAYTCKNKKKCTSEFRHPDRLINVIKNCITIIKTEYKQDLKTQIIKSNLSKIRF